MLSCVTAAAAEPAEPLTVTRLASSESKLLIASTSDGIGLRDGDGDIDSFSRAVNEAIRAQEQLIEARCRAARGARGPATARAAWEARCRYQRY
jgi:hypothetical protein